MRLRGNGNSLKNDQGLPIAVFEPADSQIKADTIFKVTFPTTKKVIGMTFLNIERPDVELRPGCISVTCNGLPVKGVEVISKNQVAFIPDEVLVPTRKYEVR